MLNKGETALPYEPYFEGLRSAPVSEAVGEGKNLWNNDAATLGSKNWTRTDTGLKFVRSSHAGGDYAWLSIPLKKGQTVTFSSVGSSYSPHLYLYKDKPYGTLLVTSNGKILYTAKEDLPNAAFTIIINSTDGDCEFSNIQVELGATATPYAPYTRATLPVPAEVQALDGYGEGLGTTCFNYIDWRKKQFTLKAYRLKLVSGGGSYSGDPSEKIVFYSLPYASIHGGKILCSHFDGLATNGAGTALRLGGFSNIEEFNAFVTENEVFVVYELATPKVIDISDLLPEDNFIGVGCGGTITFKNPHSLEVPSEITYQIKEASV